MTMVMAAVTRAFAILVSDQRITWSTTDPRTQQKSVITQEDSDTKSVLVDGRYVMGFAGHGRLGVRDPIHVRGQRMEVWLAEELADIAPEEDYFDVLAARFGLVCERLSLMGSHAFVAAGYGSIERHGASNPELILVRNSPQMAHQFDVERRPLGDEPFLFDSVGHVLPEDQRRDIADSLQRIVKRKPRRPELAIPAFLRAFRDVAPRSDGEVGQAVLVTTFPRVDVPLEGTWDIHLPGSRPDYGSSHVSQFYPDALQPSDAEFFHPAVLSRTFVSIGARGGPQPLGNPGEGFASPFA